MQYLLQRFQNSTPKELKIEREGENGLNGFISKAYLYNIVLFYIALSSCAFPLPTGCYIFYLMIIRIFH